MTINPFEAFTMNLLLKLYHGQTTFEQDVVFIFGIAALATGFLALYAGNEPSGTPFGVRFFAPVWLLDIRHHWTCQKNPNWWAPPTLAIAIAAWIFFAYVLQLISPGFLGFKATSLREIPTPLVWHEHRAAAIAFHAVQWFGGNIILSALARGLMPHSQLATVVKRAIEETFNKTQLNLRVWQTSTNKVRARYRAPITFAQLLQNRSSIAAAISENIKIKHMSEITPGHIEIEFGMNTPTIIRYSNTTKEETQYVYFIEYMLQDLQVVKIGRSNSPQNTLRACRRFVPSAQLRGALPFASNMTEAIMHARFKDERIDHETGDRESEVFALSPRITRFLDSNFPRPTT